MSGLSDMAKIGLLFTFVITVVISYNIHNEYYPDGLSQPLLMKTSLFVAKLLDDVLWCLDYVGVVDLVRSKRMASELLCKTLVQTEPDIQTEDVTIEGIPVRIFKPRDHTDTDLKLPGMIYYHGGGWTVGSIDTHHPVTVYFAREVKMVVISVGYRLNPEHSQKDGLEDCVKVTKHVIEMADQYGIDPERVVVAGDSAGGTYAAAVSLVLRDEQFRPMPKVQMLIYPLIQAIDFNLPSYQQNTKGPLLVPSEVFWFLSQVHAKNNDYIPYLRTNTHIPGHVRQHYAKDLLNHDKAIPQENHYSPYVLPNYGSGDSDIWDEIKDQLLDPYHYPLMAKHHKGLPDAYIFTGQYDALRDEGFLYARVLHNAGVSVTHYNSPVGWHGMINFVYINRDSVIVMKTMCGFST